MIPKIIHYCWFGEKDIPEADQRRIQEWKKLCPDYKFMFWNESNYDYSKNKYMREAYLCKKWGFVPDFARINVVYKYGGFYFDTDVELLKRPDDLLDNNSVFGFESENFINLGHGFAAQKGNKLLKAMLSEYENRHFCIDGVMDLTPSPKINTITMQQYGFKMNGEKQNIDGNLLLPTEYFCPLNFQTGKLEVTENTHSIHHFNASWLTEHDKDMIKFYRFINRIVGKSLGDKITKPIRWGDAFQQRVALYGWKKTFKIYRKKILGY